MRARGKLNAAYLHGCLVFAAIAGLVAQDRARFWPTLVGVGRRLLPLGRDQAPHRPPRRAGRGR
ncbi:MAG: hypothetical protein LC745_07580 [Planctomycetia bacterium]|nr:hypothetical protein [Planctomycetia bacterium]